MECQPKTTLLQSPFSNLRIISGEKIFTSLSILLSVSGSKNFYSTSNKKPISEETKEILKEVLKQEIELYSFIKQRFAALLNIIRENKKRFPQSWQIWILFITSLLHESRKWLQLIFIKSTDWKCENTKHDQQNTWMCSNVSGIRLTM